MVSGNKFFICSYTNKCKDYCDKQFLDRIKELKGSNPFTIVDNTERIEYVRRLRALAPWASIHKVMTPTKPKNSRFQRNVTESVNYLRELFLASNLPYFLIIESDVIPPKDLLERLKKAIEHLNLRQSGVIINGESRIYLNPWGIIGGLYYKGFHNYELEGIKQTHHVLSGCTVYKRELIEKIPFRYDPENLGPFPDALISADSGKEYSLWNDHDIICDHLHAENGTRMSHPI